MRTDPNHDKDLRQARYIAYAMLAFLVGAIFFLILANLLASCSAINRCLGLKDDHPLEEITEAAIEKKTGLSVDLTPSTPEQ